MKRFLILLTLPILACGGLAESVSPTITPHVPPTVTPAAQTDSPPMPETAVVPATETPIVSANTFPDPNNYQWTLIASGLNRPVDIQPAHDGTGRLFVIEKYGVIRIIENGQLLDQPFLDITDRVGSSGNEQGLLGLAFYPQPEAGMLFVNYTDKNGNTVISRFLWDNFANPMSETVLLNIQQPYPIITAARWPLALTDIFMPASATAGWPVTRTRTGKTSTRFWGRSCGWMSAISIPRMRIEFQWTTRSGARSGRMDCAIPGVFHLTASPATFTSVMWGRASGRR
jgi:hypothetical protein